MVAKENLQMVSECLEFVRRPENADKRYELIDGEIKEMPPSSRKNTALAYRIGVLFGIYLEQNNIGILTGLDCGFKVTSTNILQPDLAVEVISPSEGPRDVTKRAQAYLQAGTKVVLAVYTDERLIDVYRLNTEGVVLLNTLQNNAELILDDVLPGFKVNIDKIFSILDRLLTTKRDV